MNVSKPSRKHVWRTALGVIMAVIALYIISSNFHKFAMSLQTLRSASPGYVALAFVCIFVTFLCAAAIYLQLAVHPLRYKQTVLIEVAGAAVNRVLPAGIAGIGLHGVYLYKRKHTAAQVTAVISVNNLIGILSHSSLFLAVALFRPSVLKNFDTDISVSQFRVGGIVLLFLVILLLAIPSLRKRIASFLKNVGASLRIYAKQPYKIFRAYFFALCLTITYAAILIICTRALHLSIAPLECFVIFTIGVIAATATPTPGGLVGAEAGLFAGFVGYGVTPVSALAVTLLFRLVSYWLPVIPGVFALLQARRLKLI